MKKERSKKYIQVFRNNEEKEKGKGREDLEGESFSKTEKNPDTVASFSFFAFVFVTPPSAPSK